MKIFLFFILSFILSSPRSANSQSIDVHIGDTLYFGKGSMNNGMFAYIQRSDANMLGLPSTEMDYLPAKFSGLHAIVKKVKSIGNKRVGRKIVVVIGVGTLHNYYVNIKNAMQSGEINKIGIYKH